MNYKLIEKKTGREVQVGDTVTSFRGERATVYSWEKTGRNRVYVKDMECGDGAFFPSVFDLELVPETAEKPLPATIDFDLQPYGKVTLGSLELGEHRGSDGQMYPCLHGVVIEGKERSYLCGHVKSRSVAGESRTVYGLREGEIESGLIVRVAM